MDQSQVIEMCYICKTYAQDTDHSATMVNCQNSTYFLLLTYLRYTGHTHAQHLGMLKLLNIDQLITTYFSL